MARPIAASYLLAIWGLPSYVAAFAVSPDNPLLGAFLVVAFLGLTGIPVIAWVRLQRGELSQVWFAWPLEVVDLFAGLRLPDAFRSLRSFR